MGGAADEFQSLGWSQPAIAADTAELGVLVSHGVVLERVGAGIAQHILEREAAELAEGGTTTGQFAAAALAFETQRHRTALIRVLAAVRDIRSLAAPVQRACQSLVDFSQLLASHGAADWLELESVEIPLTPSLLPSIAAMARNMVDSATDGVADAIEDGAGDSAGDAIDAQQKPGGDAGQLALGSSGVAQAELLQLVSQDPMRAPILDLLNDLASKWTLVTDAGTAVGKRLQSRSQ